MAQPDQFALDNVDVSGFAQTANRPQRDLNTTYRRHGNIEGTQQHNSYNPHLYIKEHKGIFIFGIVALVITLGLVLGLPKEDSSNDQAASSTSLSLTSSDLPFSDSGSSTPASMPHPPLTIPTIEDPLSNFKSMTSTTPTPTQAPSTQRQPTTTATAPAPTILTPGALCTEDSQCSPNVCHTDTSTTTCCGPSIWGCPGYNCESLGFNGCLNPYSCESVSSTCYIG